MHAVGPRDQVAPPEPESLVSRQKDVAGLRDIRLDRPAQLPIASVRGLAHIRAGHGGLREKTRNQDSQERQAHPRDPGSCKVEEGQAFYSASPPNFLTYLAVSLTNMRVDGDLLHGSRRLFRILRAKLHAE